MVKNKGGYILYRSKSRPWRKSKDLMPEKMGVFEAQDADEADIGFCCRKLE